MPPDPPQGRVLPILRLGVKLSCPPVQNLNEPPDHYATIVVSDNMGLVDFATGLVYSVLQPSEVFGETNIYRRNLINAHESKILFGQVEMTFGLVHVNAR